jgi:hypothetical protein
VQQQAGVPTSFWGEAASALREATREPIRDERPHKSPCSIGPIIACRCGNSLLDLPQAAPSLREAAAASLTEQ